MDAGGLFERPGCGSGRRRVAACGASGRKRRSASRKRTSFFGFGKKEEKKEETKAEDARISVRGARRTAKDALDKLVKDKEVGEDEVTRAEKQLDAETKKHTDAVDDLFKHKEADLLAV